jgi:RNA polymerase sigma-70 factor (ECF subfamily)
MASAEPRRALHTRGPRGRPYSCRAGVGSNPLVEKRSSLRCSDRTTRVNSPCRRERRRKRLPTFAPDDCPQQMASLPTQKEGAQGADGAGIDRADETNAEVRELGFREIYGTYFGFVWRYAANRRVPPAALDDVVQEVFVVIHNRLASFEGRSSIRTWIAGIAQNVVRGYLRKPGNRAAGDRLENEDQLRAEGCSPAEALERKAALELLDEMLDKMTELQREVFILYEIEQLSGVEIAEVLRVNENTLRTRLLAARKVFNAGVARARANQVWRDRERG